MTEKLQFDLLAQLSQIMTFYSSVVYINSRSAHVCCCRGANGTLMCHLLTKLTAAECERCKACVNAQPGILCQNTNKNLRTLQHKPKTFFANV